MVYMWVIGRERQREGGKMHREIGEGKVQRGIGVGRERREDICVKEGESGTGERERVGTSDKGKMDGLR